MQVIDFVQGSPEWHEFRSKHIGSSDIASIVGTSPWKKKHELWEEKTGKKLPFESNYAMKRGSALEELAREKYIETTGNFVTPRIVVCAKYPFCMASLDGMSYTGDVIVEIKCPSSPKTLELARQGKLDKNYTCQVQWQLMISGAKCCHFFVYFADDEGNVETKTLIIEPDKEFQKFLLNEAIIFWDSVVKNIEPPKEDEEFIEINTEEALLAAKIWKESYARLEEFKKTYEALEKELEEARKQLLDETDGGNCLVDGIRVKKVKMAPCYDYKKLVYDLKITEEQLKPYKKEKNDTFRVTLE